MIVAHGLQWCQFPRKCRLVKHGLRNLIVVRAVGVGCDEIDFSAPKLADRNGAVPSQQFQVDHVFDAVSEVALPFAKQPESKSHIAQIIFGFAMQIRFALQVVSGCFEK